MHRPSIRHCRGRIGGIWMMLAIGSAMVVLLPGGIRQMAQDSEPELSHRERHRHALLRLNTQASAMDIASIVRETIEMKAKLGKQPPEPLATPATEAAIAAAQKRLGATLPEDVLALYRATDGAAMDEIIPLARIHRFADGNYDISASVRNGLIPFISYGPLETTVRTVATLKTAQLDSLLVLNYTKRHNDLLLYDLSEPPLHPGIRVYAITGEGISGVSADLSARFREGWIWQSSMLGR